MYYRQTTWDSDPGCQGGSTVLICLLSSRDKDVERSTVLESARNSDPGCQGGSTVLRCLMTENR